MKIQVVRIDGTTEIINLVGTVTAHEPGSEFEYPRNRSSLHVEATGTDYYFREDGRYDGWGMAVSDVCSIEGAKGLIDAVENDREFPKETQDERTLRGEG